MRAALCITMALIIPSISSAFQGKAYIDKTGNGIEISWMTTVGYTYQVDFSYDLTTWLDTEIVKPGTGGLVTYAFDSTGDDPLFYRIRELEDFLVLPEQDDELDVTDGVCFAFGLSNLPQLPEKIRIYRRTYDSGDPWEQIGLLTEFAEIDGIRFVRGSAVWIPPVPVGEHEEYEVRTEAVGPEGYVTALATRHITIGQNQPPTVVITAVTGTNPIKLATQVSDEDGDEIRRVEFYDNGVWIGTDFDQDDDGDFGEEIKIGSFDRYMDLPKDYDLLRGPHSLTAKAYDSRGAIGETVLPFAHEVTAGNSRPIVTIDSPANGMHVTAGESFVLECSLDDPDGLSDLQEVWVYDTTLEYTEWSDSQIAVIDDPFSSAPLAVNVDTTGWLLGSHYLGVIAWDNSGNRNWSYAQYLHVYVEDPGAPSFADTLVANIVDEVTAAPTGETFTGIELSSAEYVDGIASGLQIDEGVVLTSGSAKLWNGGDVRLDTDEYYDPQFGDDLPKCEPGDFDLEDRVIGAPTTDATILEFVVYCSNGQLELDYQFGSEEHDYFVGSFNDAFIVIITPLGEACGTVVNLLPDCSDVIEVNTVSQVSGYDQNVHLFLDNDNDITPTVSPENLDTLVEYNGMTIWLRVHALVTLGEYYSVKLAIADTDGSRTYDDVRDSALFIGNSSIRTIVPVP